MPWGDRHEEGTKGPAHLQMRVWRMGARAEGLRAPVDVVR